MSILDRLTGAGVAESRHTNGNGIASGKGLHRLAAVRRVQGVSRRTLARKLNIEVTEVRRQEDPEADLSLSKLYEWQKALDVPVSELLVESDDALSKPLLQRAQLVRLMKTALAIREQAEAEGVNGLSQTLIDQLAEVMPELRGVSAWHAVGKRRGLGELGIAAQRSMSDAVFIDLTD
jgi:transcriptional regulator with XRE-family HTH domain